MGFPFANGPAAPASRPACYIRRPPAAGLLSCGPAAGNHEGLEVHEGPSILRVPRYLRGLRVCYFEYNSTISCSCTGRLICSRVGTDPILPDSAFGSNCSHSGTPRPLTSSSACRMAGAFWLLCRTATTSPGLTENDGISTFLPFTMK